MDNSIVDSPSSNDGSVEVNMNNQAKFTFNCPHCGQPLEAETDWVGLECDCIYCGKTLIVPSPIADNATQNPIISEWSKRPDAHFTKKPTTRVTTATSGVPLPKAQGNETEGRRKKQMVIAGVAIIAVCILVFSFSRKAKSSASEAMSATNIAMSELSSQVDNPVSSQRREQEESQQRLREQQEREVREREMEEKRRKDEEESNRTRLAQQDVRERQSRRTRGRTDASEQEDNHDLSNNVSVDEELEIADTRWPENGSKNEDSSKNSGANRNKLPSLLADYRYEPQEVLNMLRSPDLTSAKRAKIWHDLFERGLPQQEGLTPGRQLFREFPDGIAFIVTKVAAIKERSDVIAVLLKLARADEIQGGRTDDWEFKHTITNLKRGDGYKHFENYWKEAPWKKQTDIWGKEFLADFPGIQNAFMMLLPMEMSGQMENVMKLDKHTIILSENWISSLQVSDKDGNTTSDFGYYYLYPSEDAAREVAGFEALSNIADELSVIPPRDERDILLKRLAHNHGNLPWLNELLRDLKGILPQIALGSEFQYIIEKATPDMEEFKNLRKAAGGNNKPLFVQELDRIIAILDSIQNRYASAEEDTIFKKYMLADECEAFQYTDEVESDKEACVWIKNRLKFEEIWESATVLPNAKTYYRVVLQAFPDDVSFAVKDIHETANGYVVDLVRLEYGKVPRGFKRGVKVASSDKDGKWLGDKRQNQLFWRYAKERFGRGECSLQASKENYEIIDLSPGDIIKSKGWVRALFVENSVGTMQQNGSSWTEYTRKLYFSGASALKNSVKDFLDMIQ